MPCVFFNGMLPQPLEGQVRLRILATTWLNSIEMRQPRWKTRNSNHRSYETEEHIQVDVRRRIQRAAVGRSIDAPLQAAIDHPLAWPFPCSKTTLQLSAFPWPQEGAFC